MSSLYDDSSDEDPMEVVLHSAGLLTKSGFADGDKPMWPFCDAIEEWHPVLIALVQRKVLPVLVQKVDVQVIETHHNPIRATHVDGVTIDSLDLSYPNCTKILTPENISVTPEEIIQIARELGQLK